MSRNLANGLGTYTGTRLLDTAGAVESLPALKGKPDTDRLRATGTMDHSADDGGLALGAQLGGSTAPGRQSAGGRGRMADAAGRRACRHSRDGQRREGTAKTMRFLTRRTYRHVETCADPGRGEDRECHNFMAVTLGW